MRDTYWFLSLYSFIVIAGIVFVLFPISMLLLGIILGLSAFYFNFSIKYADIMITSGIFSWKHWQFFLPAVVALVIAFVSFTHYARKTPIYRRVRTKK